MYVYIYVYMYIYMCIYIYMHWRSASLPSAPASQSAIFKCK